MSAVSLLLRSGVRLCSRPGVSVGTARTRNGFACRCQGLSSQASPSESPSPLDANRKARLELAVAYRALDRYGLNEGVCNHLSLMTPSARGDGEVMLMIPHGKHWSKVTSSCLLGVGKDGDVVEGEGQLEIAASSIHLGLHQSNEKARCVMHAHPPYTTSLGVLKNPELIMCHQNSTRFHERVAYDNLYHGAAYAIDEGRRLASVLGPKPVLMMCNHGVITAAGSVALAFDLLYYLERACMYQMMAMATGQEIRLVTDEFIKYNQQMATEEEENHYADDHFYGLMEVIMQETPDVAH